MRYALMASLKTHLAGVERVLKEMAGEDEAELDEATEDETEPKHNEEVSLSPSSEREADECEADGPIPKKLKGPEESVVVFPNPLSVGSNAH